MKVRDIMTRNVLTLPPECPITEAVKIFGRRVRFRHLPVVKNGRIRGLLTPFDLLALEGTPSPQTTVASVMKTNVRTTSPDTDLIEAGQVMLAGQLGCLPVVEGDGRLVGIVTGSDFLRLAVTCLQEKQAGMPGSAEESRPAPAPAR